MFIPIITKKLSNICYWMETMEMERRRKNESIFKGRKMQLNLFGVGEFSELL